MRHFFQMTAYLIVLAGWSASAGASPASEEKIAWCQFDLPPMYIANGPQAGEGRVDRLARFLMSKLPEYQHVWQFSNVARAQLELRSGAHYLCAGLQRNAEREKYMLFSIPYSGTPSPRLLTLKSHLEQLRPWMNGKDEVSLGSAVERSGLNLGVVSGRSYSRYVDERLAPIQDNPHIIVRSAAQDTSEGMLRMMDVGRIDMVIAFPSEEERIRNIREASEESIVSLSIEGLPAFVPVFVTAPRNKWGQQMLNRINAIIVKHWDDPEFRSIILYAQSPQQRVRMEAILRELDPGNSHRSLRTSSKH